MNEMNTVEMGVTFTPIRLRLSLFITPGQLRKLLNIFFFSCFFSLSVSRKKVSKLTTEFHFSFLTKLTYTYSLSDYVEINSKTKKVKSSIS